MIFYNCGLKIVFEKESVILQKMIFRRVLNLYCLVVKLLYFQLSFCSSFIYILAEHLAHPCILLTLSARTEDGSKMGYST